MADAAKLAHGSIAGHLVKQTAPTVVGVAAIMSVGLIDAYFVGHLGKDELAAISFVFPVTTALASLGVGVIAGVSSVVSRALGAGDLGEARQAGNVGIVLGLAVGIVIGATLFLLRMPLFRLLQAPKSLLPLIDAYITPYALGFPVLLTAMGINGALRGQGAAARSMAILLVLAILDGALDPVLIDGNFGLPAFGIAGAVYADIVGWIVGVTAGFVLLQTTRITFSFACLKHRGWRERAKALGQVAGPASLSNAINPIGLAILTSLLAHFGKSAVAGFGAGGRLETFAEVPLLGLSGSIGAIVGQNWGAEAFGRTRRALLEAGGYCLVYGLTAALVLFLNRHWFASLFSRDPAVIQALMDYLAISVWGYAGFGVLIMINGGLNAIDRAPTALGLAWGRVLLVMVPFAALLRGPWGRTAIFSAELASNVAGAIAGATVAVWVFGHARKKGKTRKASARS